MENLASLGRGERGHSVIQGLLHSDSSVSLPHTKASLRSGGVSKMETNLYSTSSRVRSHWKNRFHPDCPCKRAAGVVVRTWPSSVTISFVWCLVSENNLQQKQYTKTPNRAIHLYTPTAGFDYLHLFEIRSELLS